MANPGVGTFVEFSTSAAESTYGTPVVTDRWFRILSESLARTNRTLTSNGLGGTTRNLRLGTARVLTGRAAAGEVKFEVGTTTFGRMFNQIMGGAVGTPVQQGVTAAYLHTYAMGSVLGKSQTLQKVIRDAGGTVIQTLTYPGSKVMSATFSISVDGILELTIAYDAQDERTNIARASASYTSVKVFHFQQASLTVNGSAAANVRDATVKIDNPQDVDRRFLGNAGLKSEPADNNFPTVTGTYTAEIVDATNYNLFVADGGGALVLDFTGDVIASSYHEQITITVPQIHLTGESPKVGGPGVVQESIPWEATYNGSNPGATITYMSTDTAA